MSACETYVREINGEDATQVSCRALGTQSLPSMLCLLLAPATCDAMPEAFRERKIKAASGWRLPVQKLAVKSGDGRDILVINSCGSRSLMGF